MTNLSSDSTPGSHSTAHPGQHSAAWYSPQSQGSSQCIAYTEGGTSPSGNLQYTLRETGAELRILNKHPKLPNEVSRIVVQQPSFPIHHLVGIGPHPTRESR